MENIKNAYCEIDAILNHLDKVYAEKIPTELRNLFKEQKNAEYLPSIDWNEPLNEKNLMRKTIAILAMLNLDYWCEDEAEKQQLIQFYENNDRMVQDSIEKYGAESLFKQTEVKEEKINDNVTKELMEVKKGNFIKELLRKITSLFKK